MSDRTKYLPKRATRILDTMDELGWWGDRDSWEFYFLDAYAEDLPDLMTDAESELRRMEAHEWTNARPIRPRNRI
jgi:hypothetical protein